MKEYVLRIYAMGRDYGRTLAEGLTHELACTSAPDRPAAVLWQYGHLVQCGNLAISLLGGTPLVDADEYFKAFGNGSRFEPDAMYPNLQELLELYDRTHAEAARLAEQVTPEQLAAETPVERLRGRFPVVGQPITFLMTSHEWYHLGHVASWRKALLPAPARA